MTLEIREAYSESDLERGIWYNVLRDRALPNVFPYEGKVNGLHAFMHTENTREGGAPIESFRGNVQFSEEGLVRLNVKDYDCYMPEDEGYKDKWEIIKRK